MAAEEESVSAPSGGYASAMFGSVLRLFEAIGLTLQLTFSSVTWMMRPPYRITQLLAAMDFVGVQSIFIVSLTGIFSGMVLSLQTVHSLRQFGAEGIVGSIVAISLTREISPVFAALMVTARAGSAMAAELGNMRVTEQIDALVTMGVSPVQYLLSPRLLAAVIMVPLLCVLYTCVGMGGAWLVGVQMLGVDPGIFLSNIEKYLTPADFWMGEIKSATFGFLIAAISCAQGFNASGGAKGVGEATTRAVVQSAVAILVANYLLTSWLTPT
ncbi:MAG TPA: ABC transporter permease [Polyangiaceae bacterium]|nr:ABC transporter permease [Polyangiaceae bacterium]